MSLFADDMIIWLSDHKNPTRELRQLINNFSKLAGYKINSNHVALSKYSAGLSLKLLLAIRTPISIGANFLGLFRVGHDLPCIDLMSKDCMIPKGVIYCESNR